MSKPFNYGGQAVIEGVMMRGQKRMTVAVRRPDGGIEVHSEALNPRIYNNTINKIPFVRGITLLWDALGLGMRTLMYSADVAMGEEDVKFEGPMAWGTVAFSLILAVAIFFVTPLLLIGWVENYLGAGLWSNIAEGVLRLSIFLLYIWGIGFMPDIKRVFGYHGAEHKAINAYEHDVDLVPEKMAQQSITHPRCGTAFLLIVMVISIFVFALLGTPSIWLRIVSRILLIPVIAGIAYEFLKFSAAHEKNPVMKMLIAPGLALQRLTTREPDSSMLEVSAAALTQLLQEENILPQPAATPVSVDSIAVPVES
jgi:uncharacterized protein YqhQ